MSLSLHYDPTLAAIFVQIYKEAWRAAGLLQVSVRRTALLFPLSETDMPQLDEEALERLDAFRVRYAQLQDVLAGKLFRVLLRLEEEHADSCWTCSTRWRNVG